jgi:hypothetical protein
LPISSPSSASKGDNSDRPRRSIFKWPRSVLKGKRSDAEAELARLLNDAHRGTLVDPSKVKVGDYLHSWLDSKADITSVIRERYSEIIENRIKPVLGEIELQKLKPKHVHDWLSDLTKGGGLRYGQGLGPRTVRHCYRVLWVRSSRRSS